MLKILAYKIQYFVIDQSKGYIELINNHYLT